MYKNLVLLFQIFAICFAFNETEFVKLYCEDSSESIRCSHFSLSYEDWRDISKRYFVISNATNVVLNGNIRYLNEYLFEKFPKAKKFEVEYSNTYRLENEFPRSESNWRYESKIEELVLNSFFNIYKNSTSFHTLINLEKLIMDPRSNSKEIDDILLEKNVKLKNLTLIGSSIETISKDAFKNLNNLETLILSNNKISNIEKDHFRNQTKLTTLLLKTNSIQILPQAVFPSSLETLDLSYNLIKTFAKQTFRNLVNLKDLNLKWNSIDALSPNAFESNLKIKFIDLYHNQIKSVDAFFNVSSLESLDLSSNQIKDFGSSLFKNGKNLKSLDLSANFITIIPDYSFQSLSSLEYLDLTHSLTHSNQYKDFSKLESGAFSPLKNLKLLKLDNNYLYKQDLNRTHLEKLTKLEYLYLEYNKDVNLEDDTFDDLISLKKVVY